MKNKGKADVMWIKIKSMENVFLWCELQSIYYMPCFLLCTGNMSVEKTAFCRKCCQDLQLDSTTSTLLTFYYHCEHFDKQGLHFVVLLFFSSFSCRISKVLLNLRIIFKQTNVLSDFEEWLDAEAKELTMVCLRSLTFLFGLLGFTFPK